MNLAEGLRNIAFLVHLHNNLKKIPLRWGVGYNRWAAGRRQQSAPDEAC